MNDRLRTSTFVLICVVLLALQAPFIRADADSGLGWSRGPYTDEALYSSQARNAVVTGRLDLAESDAALKAPLFSAVAWAATVVLGDSMVRMRWTIAALWIVLLAWLASRRDDFAAVVLLSIPTVTLSYFPFHYGHLALAEVPASIAIVAALYCLHKRLAGGSRLLIWCAAALMASAYWLKVQFAYAALAAPLSFLIAALLRSRSGMSTRSAVHDMLLSAAAAGVFALAYVAFWMLPHRELFAFMFAQVNERSSALSELPSVTIANFKAVVRQHGTWPILAMTTVAVWAAARQWRASAGETEERARWINLMAPLAAWVLVETHKLTLAYLPSRYFVSSLIAVGLCAAAATSLLWGGASSHGPRVGRKGRFVVGGFVLAVAALNVDSYFGTISRREFATATAQRQLSAMGNWRGKTVLGPWAPALFWGTGAIAKPLWRGSFNDVNIISRFKPAAIVSEFDQQDSLQALSADGIVLDAVPDMATKVGAWALRIDFVGHCPVAASAGPVHRSVGRQETRNPSRINDLGFLLEPDGTSRDVPEPCHMFSIITWPKPEQLTWVAPSSRRAKS